jgi:GMP synthase-like glutamine amidotransferase
VSLEGSSQLVRAEIAEHTAFESTPEWIPALIEYVRDIATDPALSRLKLVGICFGHQIISLAMGARCERGTKGWEVGVYGCDVTAEGKNIFVPTGKGKADYDRVVR